MAHKSFQEVPRRSQRNLGPSILAYFVLLFRTFLALTTQMSSRPAPGAQNLSKIARKTSPKGTETDPGRAFLYLSFDISFFEFAVLSVPLSCQILLTPLVALSEATFGRPAYLWVRLWDLR